LPAISTFTPQTSESDMAQNSVFSAFDSPGEETQPARKNVREPSQEELLLAGTVKNVAAKWASHTLTLEWTDASALMSLAIKFNTQLNQGASRTEKAEIRQQIRKTLNALLYLLKANYPEHFSKEIKEWGFGKERY
jgi:hypothetical protein